MKDLTVILDAGHGGIIEGKYQTRGKRSPKRPDGSVLYEGVNNRKIVKALEIVFKMNGIKFVNVSDTEEDKPLHKRIKEANQVEGDKLYLSIHSNASQYLYIDKECTIRYDKDKHGYIPKKRLFRKEEFVEARGFGTYIFESPSKKSEEYAEIMHKHLSENLTKFTKDRGIRKRNFAVLRETNHPAILLELGFHSNLEETYLIESHEWRVEVCKSIVNAIKEF